MTSGVTVESRDWGQLPSGEAVRHFTLQDGLGLEVGLSSYGATLTSIRVADREGRIDDVLLGFDTLGGYLAPAFQAAWPYFGSTVGRFANRIAGAAFTIDGVRHQLHANEGGNQLHGGPHGFDRVVWRAERLETGDGVRLRHVSPDGDQGFPGRLEVQLDVRIEPGELVLSATAATDAPTHVNLTSHGYFNLAGRAARSIEGHVLTVDADALIPIDEAALPVGAPLPVGGTPFDLRTPTRIGDALAGAHPQLSIGDGFNHCFVLRAGAGPAATLRDPGSGRWLELRTTEPGLQLYSANAFDGTVADEGGRPFVRRQAIALEAQHFPDSPNRPDFPSTLLRPGETWRSETRLRFGAS